MWIQWEYVTIDSLNSKAKADSVFCTDFDNTISSINIITINFLLLFALKLKNKNKFSFLLIWEKWNHHWTYICKRNKNSFCRIWGFMIRLSLVLLFQNNHKWQYHPKRNKEPYFVYKAKSYNKCWYKNVSCNEADNGINRQKNQKFYQKAIAKRAHAIATAPTNTFCVTLLLSAPLCISQKFDFNFQKNQT